MYDSLPNQIVEIDPPESSQPSQQPPETTTDTISVQLTFGNNNNNNDKERKEEPDISNANIPAPAPAPEPTPSKSRIKAKNQQQLRIITNSSSARPSTKPTIAVLSTCGDVNDQNLDYSGGNAERVAALDSLDVYLATWNIHGKLPSKDLIDKLLNHNFNNNSKANNNSNTNNNNDNNSTSLVRACDIYAIGTQECEKSITASIFNPSKRHWEEALKKYFQGGSFVKLKSITLVAIHLIIFVRNSLASVITDVECDYVKNGFLHLIGNKGAVAISFKLFKRSYLFINSHLKAHQERLEERTKDYHRINYNLKLGKSRPHDPAYASNRFDFVFWLGDLNYRINGTRPVIDALMSKGMSEVLLANDQLTLERTCRSLVFSGFYEGPLDFLPTYKYDPGTDSYDTSGKNRIPSWTDRILFKLQQKGDAGGGSDAELDDGKRIGFKLVGYESCQSILLSDHKPVVAHYKLELNLLK